GGGGGHQPRFGLQRLTVELSSTASASTIPSTRPVEKVLMPNTKMIAMSIETIQAPMMKPMADPPPPPKPPPPRTTAMNGASRKLVAVPGSPEPVSAV